MTRLASLLIALVLLAAPGVRGAQREEASGPQGAAPTERMTVERLLSLQRLAEPAIAPDGRLAVVTVSTPRAGSGDSHSALWLVPATGGPARVLTTDAAPVAEPAFSPDGRWVAFVAQRSGDEAPQIYVIAIAGGEARRVTALPTGARHPRWFPDSKRLAFVSDVWTDLVRWEDQRARLRARRDGPMSGRLWSHAAFVGDDAVPDDRDPEIFSIPLDGGDPVAITRGSGRALSRRDDSVRTFDVSPDGLEVAFVTDAADEYQGRPAVVILPACGCKPARIVTGIASVPAVAPAYSPDGRYLALLSDAGGDGPDVPGAGLRLVLLDRRTQDRRTIATGWDAVAGPIAWLADSSAMLASAAHAGSAHLFRLPVAGGPPRPVPSPGTFGPPAVAASATVALRENALEPPTLVRLDVASGATVKLTAFNDAQLEHVARAATEDVEYPDTGGGRLRMRLTYPPDFDATRKYPVLVLLRDRRLAAGGDAFDWQWNAAVLSGWGYVVAATDAHDAGMDTLRAVAWLLERPFCDPDRVILAGDGEGGRIIATLRHRNHPFRAFVMQAAVDDDRGPPADTAAVPTPTLVILGGRDPRVATADALRFLDALNRPAAASRLLYFPDEGASVSRPANALFRYRTLQTWLATHAEPGPR